MARDVRPPTHHAWLLAGHRNYDDQTFELDHKHRIYFAANLGTVVAGKDDQRVVSDSCALERIQNLPHGPVRLMHKVSVPAGL